MSQMNGDVPYSPTPKPHPRVKPEAEEYALRNRGGLDKWFDHSQNTDYQSSRPPGRVVTGEAQHNADINKGCMDEIMGGYPDPPVNRTIHPRGVSKGASDIAETNKGGAMKNLIDNYGNLEIQNNQVGPKVQGSEAMDNADKGYGTANNVMYSTCLSPDAPPNQKLGAGGADVAEKHTGANMGPLLKMEGGKRTPRDPKIGRLHQVSQGLGWDETPPAHRLGSEGENIVAKQKKSDMNAIMHMSPHVSTPPPVSSPESRLPKHLQVSETPRPRTSPARTRPEALHIYQKNQNTEMAHIMHGEASTAQHQRRANPQMMRSENW